MPAPTIAVTCAASDQGGESVAGGIYTAKLDQTEIYDGFVVPEQVTATADADGLAILNLWPNALGVNGSSYRITARNPDTGKKFFDASVVVPNNPCNLYQIVQNAPFPNVDSAQQALIDVQALVTIANQYVAATNADAQQAAADRLQTGEDRTAARDSAANALTSEQIAVAAQLDVTTNWSDKLAEAAEQANLATTNGQTQVALATAQAVIATDKAGVASAQAGISTAQAGIATTKAEEASSSATAAGISADAAADEAEIAAIKAEEARASKNAAQIIATNFGNVQDAIDAAAAQAGIATTGASTATMQAGIATTKAAEALTSKNAANDSANLAGQSAAEAAENGGGAKIGEVNVFTKNQSVASVLLVSGASIPVNASLSNNFRLNIAHDGTLENPTNLTDGMVLNIRIKQDATGGRLLTFASKYKFPAAPTLQSEPGALALISGYYDATDDNIVCVMAKGFE